MIDSPEPSPSPQNGANDRPARERRVLSSEIAGRVDLALPIIMGLLAVGFGLVGWFTALWDGSFKSACEIIVRVVASFIPSPGTVTQGNWMSRLGAVLAALTTVTSAVMVAASTLGEHLTRTAARHLWTDHIVLIGDTPLAKMLAKGFRDAGQRVLHIVPPGSSNLRRLGTLSIAIELKEILTTASPFRARHVIIDLGSDTATLSLGRGLLDACNDQDRPEGGLFRSKGQRGLRPQTIALRVADPVLADQFSSVIDAERIAKIAAGKAGRLRPLLFNEDDMLARHTLAQHQLFVLAAQRRQARVHAVIIGFEGLGEKLADQIMLTSFAATLGQPKITVLDPDARRRERAFRARRPGVLDTLDIEFLEFDIGFDPFEGDGSRQFGRLLELDGSIGVTAIFLALPSEAGNLRAALLLRLYRERIGRLAAPIFYRSDFSATASDVLGGGAQRPDRFIPMKTPIDPLLKEVTDQASRNALARELHRGYLESAFASEQGHSAWDALPEHQRRANIRAADHLPAKLWSLGFDTATLLPGQVPAFDQAGTEWLFGRAGQPPAGDAADRLGLLARLEHERWSIERKLDGWRHGPALDNQKRLHPLLIPWEELEKMPHEAAKNLKQIQALLQFLRDRGRSPVVSLRGPAEAADDPAAPASPRGTA